MADLVCCICLYHPETPHEAAQAITVVQGYAVCEEHLTYVASGEEWYYIMKPVRDGH